MYPVSELYKQVITSTDRLFKSEITIQHKTGTIILGDKDLTQGSLNYTESSQPGEDFIIGGATASSLSFSIFNKDEYDEIDFDDAKVFVNISLLVFKGADAHFLQPSQPSKMPGVGSDLWEPVPLGVFTIDSAKRRINTIDIKAMDNMAKTELPYSLSKLSYPASLYQIYIDACNVCDILPATINFPNKNVMIGSKPKGDFTFRDIFRSVAQLSGTFAKVNRNGAMELKWYEPSGITIEPMQRENLFVGDGVLQITGITATVEDVVYIVGTDDYVIDLTGNPLLQDNFTTLLNGAFNNIRYTSFMPFDSSWQGNPALQAGDMITQIDRLGKEHNTLITSMTYKYRGKSSLSGKGLPIIRKRYKGSMGKLVANISQKVGEQIGDLLTPLETAQANATDLISKMLGGYLIEDKANGIIYIADNPNIDLATKIWKYGIDGFGYSSTGINGPYNTAVTADGSIVAMLVAANIITANMIQTGILQANNGKSFFDLDNGILRISHGGTEYSQMDINGFGKKSIYGDSYYLNDITVLSGSTPMGSHNERDEATWTSVVRIPLDVRFRGKNIEPYASLRSYNLPVPLDDNIRFGIADIETFLSVVAWNTNISNPSPYVEVRGYSRWKGYLLGSPAYYYRNVDFQLMVVAR